MLRPASARRAAPRGSTSDPTAPTTTAIGHRQRSHADGRQRPAGPASAAGHAEPGEHDRVGSPPGQVPAVPGGEENGAGDGEEQPGDEQRVVLDGGRLDGAGGVAPAVRDVTVGEQRREVLGHGQRVGPAVRVHHHDVRLRDLGVGIGQRGVGVDGEPTLARFGEVGHTAHHARHGHVAHRGEGTGTAAGEARHRALGRHAAERDAVADPKSVLEAGLGDGDLVGAARCWEAPFDHDRPEPAAGRHGDERARARTEAGRAADHHLDVGRLLDACVGGQHVADRVGDLARREDDDVGPSRPLRHPVDRGRGAARSRDRGDRDAPYRAGQGGEGDQEAPGAPPVGGRPQPRREHHALRSVVIRSGELGWAADAVTPHRVRLFPPPIAITQPPIRRTTAHKGRDDTGRPWSRRVAGVGRWARSRSHGAREARNSPWSGEFRA